MTAIGIASLVFLGTVGLVVGGWILGVVTATATFGWIIGFDVRSLPWLWGAWGEEQTAAALAKLGPDWFTRHDIERKYGNWDHVVVGPTGVFMIDTKRLSGRVSVKDDGVSSGRLRIGGSSFRGASLALRESLLERSGPCPWVQAVVAIWGDFADGSTEVGNVAYVAGDRLVEWLKSRPATLDGARIESLSEAIRTL